MLGEARVVVQDAYAALEHRHAVMRTVWTLTGPDAMTPAPDLVAALENPDPDGAMSSLSGRDIGSEGGAPRIRAQLVPGLDRPGRAGRCANSCGPASLVELRGIRRELERVQKRLEGLRFALASALYRGEPTDARRVLDPDTGEELIS